MTQNAPFLSCCLLCVYSQMSGTMRESNCESPKDACPLLSFLSECPFLSTNVHSQLPLLTLCSALAGSQSQVQPPGEESPSGTPTPKDTSPLASPFLQPWQITKTHTDPDGLQRNLFNCSKVIICMQKTLRQNPLCLNMKVQGIKPLSGPFLKKKLAHTTVQPLELSELSNDQANC